MNAHFLTPVVVMQSIIFIYFQTEITNSNKALVLAKQNVKKLQLQLKAAKEMSEATILDLQKQQAKVIQLLNEKVLSLFL